MLSWNHMSFQKNAKFSPKCFQNSGYLHGSTKDFKGIFSVKFFSFQTTKVSNSNVFKTPVNYTGAQKILKVFFQLNFFHFRPQKFPTAMSLCWVVFSPGRSMTWVWRHVTRWGVVSSLSRTRWVRPLGSWGDRATEQQTTMCPSEQLWLFHWFWSAWCYSSLCSLSCVVAAETDHETTPSKKVRPMSRLTFPPLFIPRNKISLKILNDPNLSLTGFMHSFI